MLVLIRLIFLPKKAEITSNIGNISRYYEIHEPIIEQTLSYIESNFANFKYIRKLRTKGFD